MRLGRLPIDGFLLSLVIAIAAAAAAPFWGATHGPLHVDTINQIGVSLVFFFHGVGLPTESLQRGIRAVRLHLVAQGTTFLVFPAFGMLLLTLSPSFISPPIALGCFFLCVVSSTISSSVALTAIAGGDVAGALFNATLSGILGVFLTPLYASLVAHTAGLAVPLGTTIEAIALKILLPLAIGQISRPFLKPLVQRQARVIALADRGSIVLIVYGAFCDSIAAGTWNGRALGSVFAVITLTVVLLAATSFVNRALVRLARLDRNTSIAAYFCGTQKSLANGLPIARAMFGQSALLGLIVLPLIVYHLLQIAVGSVIARSFAQERVAP
jgi:solute carrier family 10 (sodium/bile acid cotransporter), member 7